MKSRLGIAVLATFLLVPAVPATAINIYSRDIVDGEVKTADLDSNAVTTTKILNGEVKTADLDADAVTTNKILNGTIVTDDLANGAVTDAKISGPISASKIMKAGLDADTLDGIDSTGFAPASHVHAQSDVNGLAEALAGKADASHNHDAVYQRKYANVIVVSLDGNGDYTSPVAAMNAIYDSGPANPYLVKIRPGTYDIGVGTVQMKDYVDIEGSGEGITKITSAVVSIWSPYDLSNAHGTIHGANNAELRMVTVEAAGGSGAANSDIFPIFNNAVSPRIADVTALVSGHADINIGIYNAGDANPIMNNVTVNVLPQSGGSIGVLNMFGPAPLMNNMSIYVASANTQRGIWNWSSGSVVISNTTVTVEGGYHLARGIDNDLSVATLSNASVQILTPGLPGYEGVAFSNGAFSGVTTIDKCTLSGEQSISHNGGNGLKVGASKLVGTVLGGPVCAASYDGDYDSLDRNCQPLP